MEGFVNLFLWLISGYLLAGLIFYVVCVTGGLKRIDPDTVGAPIGFRLIIAPGVITLWPALVRKWITKKKSE